MLRYVAYYRVSTKRQGQSGLGLDAQREAVQAFARDNGGKITAEFIEVETGKRSDRPKLQEAISRTRGAKATLVVARLDRLARNVAFTAALMESGVEFVACDNPHANRLTIHILAAVAESEAIAIATRTRDALAAAKRRGVKLGTHRPGHVIDHAKGTRRGLAKAVATAAADRAQRRQDCFGHLMPDIRVMRAAGDSLAMIADKLNAAGHETTSGRAFAPMTVARLLA